MRTEIIGLKSDHTANVAGMPHMQMLTQPFIAHATLRFYPTRENNLPRGTFGIAYEIIFFLLQT